MRKWNQWGGLALALWAVAAAAEDVPPPRVPPQRVPVAVGDLGVTARLAVDRIKSTLLPGDELGHTSFGVFCINAQPLRVGEEFAKNFGAYETSVATQLLKKYGYPLATLGTSTAFATDVAAAPDFRLGGIVKELKVETCSTGNDTEGWIYLKVDWALYSEKEQKVVFQQTTEGLAVSDKKVSDLRRQAIVSTVENFIAAPEFLAAIKPGAVPPVAAASGADEGKGIKKDSKKAAPASGDVPAPVVAIKAPIQAGHQDLKVKLAVDTVKVAMLPGDELGHSSFGAFCSGVQPMTAGDGFMKNYGGFVSTVVAQTLKKNGYPLVGLGKTSAFDTEQNVAPDFRVGGILKELRMEVCQTGNNAEGWIYAKIDWALYSEKAKRVVFSQTTEGLVKSNDKIPDMPTKAITVSVENLLAAPEFLAALQAPQEAAAEAPAPGAMSAAAPVTPEAGGHSLEITGAKPLPGGAQKNQAKLRAAVVTLETANGSGSGFYIDREGYLLTDFHVIDGAKFVKVKMANGDKLVAQVVKVSERDDVALLKSVSVDFDPLAIRPDVLDVGEEVYAIGTPLGVLTSTMTRGVLSADRSIQGVHVLQSDAAITFGSSGGPLLDAEGRVIGLSKSVSKVAQGFNLFIPIQDALRVLGVSIKK